MVHAQTTELYRQDNYGSHQDVLELLMGPLLLVCTRFGAAWPMLPVFRYKP